MLTITSYCIFAAFVFLVFGEHQESVCSRNPTSSDSESCNVQASDGDKLLKDPLRTIEIAVGDPFPELKIQERDSGIEKDGVFHDQVTRYVLKKAHLSFDDFRVYSMDGSLVANSHHPGKVG